ncbi:unnamed protein product [Lampetra fluviatilis]
MTGGLTPRSGRTPFTHRGGCVNPGAAGADERERRKEEEGRTFRSKGMTASERGNTTQSKEASTMEME